MIGPPKEMKDVAKKVLFYGFLFPESKKEDAR